MLRQIFLVLGLVLILVACEGAQNPMPTNPTEPTNPTNPTNPDSGSCTYVLTKNITVPSRLVNTPAACDYSLEGYVKISSTLLIDPGVRVVAKQDADIVVDGGQIIAVGTPEQRIVMEGLNPIAGYWGGIRFYEGRESQFEYFDLKDAGQVCTIMWCPDAALIFDDVTVSLANSSVSNSYVHGLHATSDVLFTKFENNRFYNNIFAGIFISAVHIDTLDVGSDYSGEPEPNGMPYVFLTNGDLESGDTRRWKNLNAPYFIDGYLDIEGGIVIIEPGVSVVFDEGSWLHVKGNGELRAVGTADKRISFIGERDKAGYWDGITFWDSDWEENELSYVDIKHSGNDDSLVAAYGGVRMKYTSSLKVNNSTFSDNAKFGISCDKPDRFDTVTLTLGSGNSFSNNALGDIDPDCEVMP